METAPPTDDWKGFVIIFVVLFFVWLFSGGLTHDIAKGGIFLNPLPPVGSGQAYGFNYFSFIGGGGMGGSGGNYFGYSSSSGGGNLFFSTYSGSSQQITDELKKIQTQGGASPYSGKVYFTGSGGAGNNNAKYEYIELRVADNVTKEIPFTGWKLTSVISGRSASIGKGVYLPYSGQVNPEEYIFVKGGDRVIIQTSRSPIGYSFRENTCTGYFEQFQDFYPALPLECPRPIDERLPTPPNALNDKCLDYIESISQCRIVTETLPLETKPECSTYVGENINYPKCVEKHKNDKNFYKNEWRVFLNYDDELWKQQRELIKLTDQNGAIVDLLTY